MSTPDQYNSKSSFSSVIESWEISLQLIQRVAKGFEAAWQSSYFWFGQNIQNPNKLKSKESITDGSYCVNIFTVYYLVQILELNCQHDANTISQARLFQQAHVNKSFFICKIVSFISI